MDFVGNCSQTKLGADLCGQETGMMQSLTLRYGDCVKVLREYEKGSVGAVICDPPYDQTTVSGVGGLPVSS